jgi:hypothetical protein
MQPAFLLERRCKFNTLTPTSPEFPKNFARLTAGLKKTPPPLSATFWLGMKKFQRTLFVFGGFAPCSFFSSYPICGSSSKKQRGDE